MRRGVLFALLALALAGIGPAALAHPRRRVIHHRIIHHRVVHHRARRRPPKRRILNLHEAHLAIQRKRALAGKLHQLHYHMHLVRVQIHAAAAKAHHINQKIAVVHQNVAAARHKLNEVGNRMQLLQAEHHATQAKLIATRNKLSARRDLLSARIREDYMRGQTTYAAILLQARSLQDLLARRVYVRQIMQSDLNLIYSIQRNIASIRRYKKHLEELENAQNILAQHFENRKQVYLGALALEQKSLHSALAQRDRAQGDLDVLVNQAEEMTGTVQMLENELDARRHAEEQAWLAAHPHASRRARHRAESHFAYAPIWHGKLIRPVHGPITSPFGMRFHPILHRWIMHTGVDFGVPEGTPIHAAGSGVVILAHYVNGYGYTVVIDHGGGLSTLYGHCSRLLVHAGEEVKQGQVIALVGATGLATGPNLHFEVRHDGRPVRPF